MKNNSKTTYSVGLDIGNSKICAVAGKKSENGEISILHYAEEKYDPDYESMSKGFSKNRQNLNQTASRVLQKLANSAELDIASVNSNISNEFISLKSYKEEYTNNGDKFTVNENTLETLIKKAKDNFNKTEKKECIHPLPVDFYIDELKVTKYPEGSTGNKLTCNFNFVVAEKDILRAHNASTEGLNYSFMDNKKSVTGVAIDQLIYSPIADALSTLSTEDKQNGILLVNFGAQLTEITIFKDFGIRYTHVLGIGSQALLKDLCHAFNLTEKQAEEILLISCEKPSKDVEINEVLEIEGKDGLPTKQISLKSIALVIESRLKEIIGLVASNVIESGYARVLGNGIMVTGAIARVHLVKRVFEQSFSPLTVRIGDSTRNVNQNAFFELSHPRYSTAIGLMLSSLVPLDERVPKNNLLKTKSTLGGFFKNTSLISFLGKFEDHELSQTYN